jgi:two-component system, OmpR family, response regulator MtrA
MAQRILVIEDDPLITRMLEDNLKYEGYEVQSISNGDRAFGAVRAFAPHLILLDVMLPGLGGFEICRAISEGSSRIPIIILSARSQSADKVQGLRLGADDYITKPFTVDELLARIQAVMRRTSEKPDVLVLGDGYITIDFSAFTAVKGGQNLVLTPREFQVLQLLSSRRNQVVTREELLRSVWGYSELPLTRTVDHFIARLRSKIEPDPHHPRFLHTVYGDGYRLTTTVE